MAKMIESFGDMEKMTEASFLLLTNLVQSIKIVVFNIYRPRVWQLVESMNREAFKPRNVEQYNMLLREIKKSKLITISFLIACVITCASWGISPLLDTTVTNGRKLPLSGWYPFETEASPIFELTYAYQMFVTTVGGLGNISMDTFLSGCIMNLSAQISVLNNALENMKSQQVNTDEKTNESLIKNVVHHRNILQFAEEFTNLFTTCITGMFVVGVIIVCISMFQMSLVPVLSFRFLAMLLYQICILEEMYLWCYYGNEVILKSNKLTESAYKCQWIDSSKEFKQHLLYFMTRTQIPLNLYSSGYFVLSLETFKAIVKSSWSYFAVLNQVHSKQID
ncbi:odorant receptor Or1-like [Tribolium madens]|uniref:odorant receptor Or1-like n=1 Tax=Tribolium madens TaxID=41895 RepID=UPI001CF74C91|nr:odorant receptor Or1-like [Tribolium madens]